MHPAAQDAMSSGPHGRFWVPPLPDDKDDLVPCSDWLSVSDKPASTSKSKDLIRALAPASTRGERYPSEMTDLLDERENLHPCAQVGILSVLAMHDMLDLEGVKAVEDTVFTDLGVSDWDPKLTERCTKQLKRWIPHLTTTLQSHAQSNYPTEPVARKTLERALDILASQVGESVGEYIQRRQAGCTDPELETDCYLHIASRLGALKDLLTRYEQGSLSARSGGCPTGTEWQSTDEGGGEDMADEATSKIGRGSGAVYTTAFTEPCVLRRKGRRSGTL